MESDASLPVTGRVAPSVASRDTGQQETVGDSRSSAGYGGRETDDLQRARGHGPRIDSFSRIGNYGCDGQHPR